MEEEEEEVMAFFFPLFPFLYIFFLSFFLHRLGE